MNWPALGAPRDEPDESKLFGQPGYDGPLVWQTFRGKVEIFPGQGTPHGYTPKGGPDYGYNDPPRYVYGRGVSSTGEAPACSGQNPPRQPAWVNLDETSEIGLNQMFAGAAPDESTLGQQVLFMAKANKAEYAYVAANGWWSGNAPLTATGHYVATEMESPPPGSSTLVSFPTGTFEIKAAWRKLSTQEEESGRFQINTVRFYETAPNAKPCYREDRLGLIALHIIHKTPTAPYFVFATFGQADNLLDAAGQPIEDPDGRIIRNRPALEARIHSRNAVTANPASPVSIQQLTPAASGCEPERRIYYRNTPPDETVPPSNSDSALPQGDVCIERRLHEIPAEVIEVNAAAHETIRAYNSRNGIVNSPWLFYKLVNVQAYPIDKGDENAGKNYSGPNVATYYQANVVVESDYNLQVFSGKFQSALPARRTAMFLWVG